MKLPAFCCCLVPFGLLLITGCQLQPSTGDIPEMAKAKLALYPFKSQIPHAPKLAGWTQIPANDTSFRGHSIQHPSGLWTVRQDEKKPDPPIVITTASGKANRLSSEWNPAEGGADSAYVFAFIKADETLIIIQGTSDLTYEETRVIFRGDEVVDLHRYGQIGGGPLAPGIAPKHRIFPPN